MAIQAMGLEANPMAWFASTVKTQWDIDPNGLRKHAAIVAQAAKLELDKAGIEDITTGLSGMPEVPLKHLPEESHKLLLANSISPLPLHKTLVLLEQLERHRNNSFYQHERLCLAKAIVHPVSNLHFGPEVGVGSPKADAPVIAPWIANVQAMAGDIDALQDCREMPATVLRSDARDIASVLRPSSVDGVITSPPYPNEKDYTRTTRLESVLLGLIRNRSELKAFKKQLMRSNTRNVYRGDDDDQWVSSHPVVQRIAKDIEARRISLGKTSGFERMYAKVTRLYFGGMARHLAQLRLILRPGARLAYVVGDQASYLRVMIRTGHILADIAQRLGYQVDGVDLFRTRLATATREQLREEVVLLRWVGTGPAKAPK
jgi:hypothetical protein